MIYASLRTIRQWHQPLTAPIYIALGLASGAVLLNLLLALFGRPSAGRPPGSPSSASSSPRRSSGSTGCASTARRARTPSRPRPASATSARCARSSRRTRSPTSSCARWATASRASTPSGCASWRCCWPSRCPSPSCCCRWCRAPASLGTLLAALSMAAGLRRRALAVLRRGRARRHALLRRRCGVALSLSPSCGERVRVRGGHTSRGGVCCRPSPRPSPH